MIKILIVEDNDLARVLLRNVLAPRGVYEITEAAHGLAAWELLNKGLHPDLCILDLMMPEMSGIELLKRIRADDRFRGLKVVVCSVTNDKHTITQVAALQVKHYILKPFKVQFVLETVEQALGRAAREPIEPANLICDRLGITVEKLKEMLEEMSDTLQKALVEIRAALEKASLPRALALICAQREISQNLGAVRIASHLAEVQEGCSRAIQSPASSVFLEQLRYLTGLLDQVDAENHRLKESLPRVAAHMALAS